MVNFDPQDGALSVQNSELGVAVPVRCPLVPPKFIKNADAILE